MSDQPTGETLEATEAAQDAVEQAQETFDAERAKALIDKLRSEIKELKPKAKKAEELDAQAKAQAEKDLSEAQKLAKRLAEVEAELSATKRRELQTAVAKRHGLPDVLATRLQGETPEELEADAKALAATLPKPNLPATNPGGNAQQGMTDAERRARLYGWGSSPFDADAARKSGGGVVITSKE